MNKYNIRRIILVIIGSILSPFFLAKCFEYNNKVLMENLLIALFTGCIVAIPNIVLFLLDNVEDNRRKLTILVDDLVEYLEALSISFGKHSNADDKINYINKVMLDLSEFTSVNYFFNQKIVKFTNLEEILSKLCQEINSCKSVYNEDKINEILTPIVAECITRAKEFINYPSSN